MFKMFTGGGRSPEGNVATRSRYAVAAEVLQATAGRRTAELTEREVDAVSERFGGVEEFLLYLQARWFRTFEAHLDTGLESGRLYSEPAMAAVAAQVRRTHSQETRLLERYAGCSSLQTAARRRSDRLAELLGLSGPVSVDFPGAAARDRLAA